MITLFLMKTKDDFSNIIPILTLYALIGYRLLPAAQLIYFAFVQIHISLPTLNLLYKDLQSLKFVKKENFNNTFDPYAKASISNNGLNGLNGVEENDKLNYASLNGEGYNNKYTDIAEGYENQATQDPTTCIKKEKLTSKDLLPKDAQNLVWSKINPSSQANIEDQNFLTAGYHIGVNTIGQSLRNANLQLRSEIPNPQVAVSPWLISTIEPDIRSTTIEIGSAPSY